jgi:hypothetical protein
MPCCLQTSCCQTHLCCSSAPLRVLLPLAHPLVATLPPLPPDPHLLRPCHALAPSVHARAVCVLGPCRVCAAVARLHRSSRGSRPRTSPPFDPGCPHRLAQKPFTATSCAVCVCFPRAGSRQRSALAMPAACTVAPAHVVARCSSAARCSGRPLAPATRLHRPCTRPARLLPPSARAAWAPAAQRLRAPKPSRPVPSRGRAARDPLAPPKPAPPEPALAPAA